MKVVIFSFYKHVQNLCMSSGGKAFREFERAFLTQEAGLGDEHFFNNSLLLRI